MNDITDDIQSRVVLLNRDDAFWDFGQEPYFKGIKRAERDYPADIKFEPVPCYHHEIELVKKMVDKVESIFPIKYKPIWYG